MRAHLPTLAMILALAAGTAAAQPAAKPMSNMKGMSSMPASATKTGKGTGVITEVDPKGGTLTIKHEAIATLGWPAMTMSFKAAPASLLKGLKVGQKIGFDANQGSGLPEVTAIRKP